MTDSSGAEAESVQTRIRLAAEIVSAYVTRNLVAQSEVARLIQSVHDSLATLDRPEPEVKTKDAKQKPAVPISRSVQHDHIICLEDGKRLTMLKRYLRSRYDMSPEAYRQKWKLPPDYPMVAPAYADRRSQFAKSIGLGTGVRRKSSAG
jgi:predicted transcriptional regulator